LAEALKKLGFRLVTNFTENHMVIIDVSPFGLTGRHAETALRQAHITCNRNAIPFDKNGPWYTSGVRLGTPALTTLGMGVKDMEMIASMIHECLSNATPSATPQGGVSKAQCTVTPNTLKKLNDSVLELLSNYPLYPEIEVVDQATVLAPS
ncbi:MAG: glyA, partial [Chlamydiia bacterium]|nr:glyA [Chlamydiia bacterium]